MIVLFTDFGPAGPYTGQVMAVLCRDAPGVPVIDLLSDAPAHDPRPAAYLLAALVGEFPAGAVFLCVVDPGVGGDRPAGVLEADGRWYVGPGNGLFELVVRRAEATPRWWEILWRPERLSASFHGRDLFAPVAARLALGRLPEDEGRCAARPIDHARRTGWTDELEAVVYIDVFGNAVTGVRAAAVSPRTGLSVNGRSVLRTRTFSDVSPGCTFCYENANGLLEIAVNQGRADVALDLEVGTEISLLDEV